MGIFRRVKQLLGKAVKLLGISARKAKKLLRAVLRNLKKFDTLKWHDIFNLVSVGLLNVVNFAALFSGKHYQLLFKSTLAYFIADTVYIALWPNSAKSPGSILLHHLVCTAYLVVPWSRPRHHWCAPYAMVVEVNTWLQIARRNLPIPGLDLMFYASWVGLRLMWFPYLVVLFGREWLNSGPPGQRDSLLFGAVASQAFLSALNYYWTWGLFSKLARRKKRTAVRAVDKAAIASSTTGSDEVFVPAEKSTPEQQQGVTVRVQPITDTIKSQ